MAKQLGIQQFFASKKKVMDFKGEWLDGFGCPEFTGSWIIWGPSGSGKTRFACMLCKELAKFGKVAYNSLEEGDSDSLKKAFMAVGMEDVSGSVVLLDREPISELTERLSKRKSPDIIFIDSYQYTGMTYNDYKKLKEQFRKKLFVFISHADGKDPAGRSAKSVRYDCNCKIRVEGYRAMIVSRYGGGKPIDIWAEGAARYWGELNEEL